MGGWRSDILAALCDARLLRYTMVLWGVVIAGRLFFLPPGSDDALWIQAAIQFLSSGEMNLRYLDQSLPDFSIFPGYMFAYSAFYGLWDLAGLPINVFTYKIFDLLIVGLAIYLGVKLLRLSSADAASGNLRGALFLAFLGITPFGMDILYPCCCL